jgi:hypothetical protein
MREVFRQPMTSQGIKSENWMQARTNYDSAACMLEGKWIANGVIVEGDQMSQ